MIECFDRDDVFISPDNRLLMLIYSQYLQGLSFGSKSTDCMLFDEVLATEVAKVFGVPTLATTAFQAIDHEQAPIDPTVCIPGTILEAETVHNGASSSDSTIT